MHKHKVLRFGLDYLKYNFKKDFTDSEFASFFIGLSENSKEKDVKWFNYWFRATATFAKGNMIIHFSYEGRTVLQLKRYTGSDMAGQYLSYSIDFYGAYFMKPYLRNFYRDFYKKYGQVSRLSRIDIACDINASMAEFEKYGFHTGFKKLNKFGEDSATGIAETIYFGQKSIKNKRHFIRVYDKLKDTKNKGDRFI